MQALKELLFRLCSAPGTSGWEDAAAEVIRAELSRFGRVEQDCMGNITAHMGKAGAQRHVLLDAHMDQVGLVVTYIDENGFLKVAPAGGVDRRVLPGSPVTIYGEEKIQGIVCCLPPHLSDGGEEKVAAVDRMSVDAGLPKEEAERLIPLGSRIVVDGPPRELLGTRVASAALDDRAGVAALIRCAELLTEEPIGCELTLLCSSREETGAEGAKTAAYSAKPTEAIIVDVSFAAQPGVPREKACPLGGGPMIGRAPLLSRLLSDRLAELAEEYQIPYQLEIMGGSTGTNTDEIAALRGGVPSAMVSIPLRYMHTPAEIVDLEDIEHTAQLLAAYIRGVA
jgi:putative aminopeptidase FrvX